jgi:hypothetical protein
MKVLLEAIKFNHNPASAVVDAFSVRRNETQFVNVPEWQRLISVKAEDSPAAYALRETRGQTLTIQAKFSCTDPGAQGIQIRALDASISPRPSTALSPLPLATFLLRPILREMVGGVLGEVKERQVFFNGDETDFETFELNNVRLWETGVGVNDISWRWQFRATPDGTWTDFADSTHRIYTVLRQPRAPWQEVPHDPTNTQLPWTEVLDYACRWAAGAKTPEAAAALITRRIFELGPEVIQFDEKTHAKSHLTQGDKFNCTTFLSRLRGGATNYRLVNCTDCATIVSSFANCVGCDLSQSRIVPVAPKTAFALKPTIRIGFSRWVVGGFKFHEVAWTGECRENDEIFDACLKVDGDDDPCTRTPLLPQNLRFGQIGEHGYRFRLVDDEHEKICQPSAPLSRVRRLIGLSARSERPAIDLEFIVERAKSFDFEEWADVPGLKLFANRFFLAPGSLTDWRFEESSSFVIGDGVPVTEMFWRKKETKADVVIRIDLYELSYQRDARLMLLQQLADFQLPGIERLKDGVIGDVTFASPSGSVLLFAAANLVFLLRNVGRDTESLTEVSALVNTHLVSRPSSALVKSLPPLYRFRFEKEVATVGEEVRLVEEPPDPSEGKRLLKFFFDSGSMSLQNCAFVYLAEEPGDHSVTVYAIDARGEAFEQTLPLSVIE